MRRAVLAVVALLALATSTPVAGQETTDLVHIASNGSYTVQPDQGPVRSSWQITIENNNPQGRHEGISSLQFPVLSGATSLDARSASGKALKVTLGSPREDFIALATVQLDKLVYYQESYSLTLAYEVTDARHPALIVLPAYTFIPLLAAGDEATVTASLPGGEPWASSLQAGACAQDGNTFSCTGSDAVFVAGVAEVARPDLTTTTTVEAQLREQTLPVTITHFQGEEEFGRHVAELTAAALPVIEDLYGVTYKGPPVLNVSERVRQVILGYEGLTTCDGTEACEVSVSPIADDHTIIHELAHLWSHLYENRWLSEGFAQYVAAATPDYLPESMASGPAPIREQTNIELQLDDWGEVESVIGASEDQLAIENAGYYRSHRFLEQLEYEVGPSTLRKVNRELAARGTPADSRRFMDVLEEVSGRDNDGLFREWVFPDSMDSLLTDRREARDRLTNVIALAQQEGLSDEVPGAIQERVDAWRFDEAIVALEEAEAGLDSYATIKEDLRELKANASAAGLTLEDDIDRMLLKWDFAEAGAAVREAKAALAVYRQAEQAVEAPRGLWKRFGLLGRDPEGSLAEAAVAFNRGDYSSATAAATDAMETVDGAARTATRRALAVTAVLGVFSVVVLGAVWLSRSREREFA